MVVVFATKLAKFVTGLSRVLIVNELNDSSQVSYQTYNNIKKALETLATKKVSIVLVLNFREWM
jgi:hypothetical protein